MISQVLIGLAAAIHRDYAQTAVGCHHAFTGALAARSRRKPHKNFTRNDEVKVPAKYLQTQGHPSALNYENVT